jgi:hypothetical protein
MLLLLDNLHVSGALSECKLLLSDWFMLTKLRSLSLQYLWYSCRDCSAVPWREEASSYSSHIPTSPAALPLTLKGQCHEIFFSGVNDTGGNNGNNVRRLTPKSGFWRKKFIYMLTLLPRRSQTKYLKLFWFATGANDTGDAPWAPNISSNFL